MASTGSVKAKIQGLIDKSNNVTGKTFTDLTSAVGDLVTSADKLNTLHEVRFYNDDRETLLYTVYVPSGRSAVYAGETPVSTEDESLMFVGFEPAAVNVTADMDCYATYEVAITTLDAASWNLISELSEAGTAQNYFAVGDIKTIHIEGTVGTLEVNGDYGVFILGFNHNQELEGNGIHFGTFKTVAPEIPGTDISFLDEQYYKQISGDTKYFSINHWGASNRGGWAGCDMRYDILGSTDNPPSDYGTSPVSGRTGYDPSATCATKPVANTLMDALPEDLRAVMKPMVKYTNNSGGTSDKDAIVTSCIDYLPLLAVFEVLGARENASNYEQTKQKQYDYYIAGNSKTKYKIADQTVATYWWTRSAIIAASDRFCTITMRGDEGYNYTNFSFGIAPIFKV